MNFKVLKINRCHLSHIKTPRLACIHNHHRIVNSLKARWSFDVKFGHKQDAIKLVNEWIEGIGSKAGLTTDNTSMYSGSIGIPESKIELEIEFDELSEIDKLWQNISYDEHKAWSERLERYIIHGSSLWTIFTKHSISLNNDEIKVKNDQEVDKNENKEKNKAVFLDWKGDSMVLNEGDKLPFFK